LALPALAFSSTSWKVEHQQGVLQRLGGLPADLGVVEQFDQRMHVVAAQHGAEQFGGALDARSGDRHFAAERHGRQVSWP
jgi:hypothetical protein